MKKSLPYRKVRQTFMTQDRFTETLGPQMDASQASEKQEKMKISKNKTVIIILIVMISLPVGLFLHHLHSMPRIDSSVDQYGKWSLSTQRSLSAHDFILPNAARPRDLAEYVLIEYPETMKLPMYYLSCRLAQAGDLMQWKSRCEAESYIRISDKNDRRAVYCSEETIGSIREIMNDEIFDGMKLFFSFVEFREIEQEIVFTVAEVEDGLNTGISSLDHYLFSLIGVQ